MRETLSLCFAGVNLDMNLSSSALIVPIPISLRTDLLRKFRCVCACTKNSCGRTGVWVASLLYITPIDGLELLVWLLQELICGNATVPPSVAKLPILI